MLKHYEGPSQSEALSGMRREYIQKAFNEEDCAENPIEQFKKWFDHAVEKEVDMPNAMSIASVSAEGQPSSRVVLLKHYDEKGFVFFSSYSSRKGKELATNPKCSLLFHWKMFDRQVHIYGEVAQVDKTMSDEYFASRPLESQISASISEQSALVESRQFLEKAYKEKAEALGEGVAPQRPEDWGGFCVTPSRFEFWQGRANRLHDRLVYERNEASWKILRLAP